MSRTHKMPLSLLMTTAGLVVPVYASGATATPASTPVAVPAKPAVAVTATAQPEGSTPPDPFDDYAATHADSEPVAAAPYTPSTRSETTKVVDGTVPTRAGNYYLGASVSFDYAGSSNEQINGPSLVNHNFFTRISPKFGYFVIDRLEIGGSLGLLWKSLSRTNEETTTESDLFLEATAHYHVPAGRFSLAPGLGLGGYFGGSSRPLSVNGKATTESTSTRGFQATLYLTGAYQVSDHWQLRSGLSLTGLVGSETVGSVDQSLSSSAFYVGIPVQLNYTFR
jgi:hypothetical protein